MCKSTVNIDISEVFAQGYTLNNRENYFSRPLKKGEKNTCRGAFTDLIQFATHRDHNGLSRGQLRTSERKLANVWHWSRRKVRALLAAELEAGTLAVESSPRGMIITIVDYDKDQNPDSYRKQRPANLFTPGRTTPRTTERTTQNPLESRDFDPAVVSGPLKRTTDYYARAKELNTSSRTRISKQNACAGACAPAREKNMPANMLPFKIFSVQKIQEELERQCAENKITLAKPGNTAFEIWFSERGGRGGYFRNMPKLVGMWLIHLPETRLAPELRKTDEEYQQALKDSIDRLVAAGLLKAYANDTEYNMRIMEVRYTTQWLPMGECHLSQERVEALRAKAEKEGKLIIPDEISNAAEDKEKLDAGVKAKPALTEERRIIGESVDKLVAAGFLDPYQGEEEFEARVKYARSEYKVLLYNNIYVSEYAIKLLFEIRELRKSAKNPNFGENRRIFAT